MVLLRVSVYIVTGLLQEPERIIFHIVTDSLNLPAISMWFLLYDPGKATIEIQSIDQFKWLSNNIDITKQKEDSPDMRYTSALNHLRFYLPDMFPKLDKILLLDHDVIVQRDLTELWNIEMMGKTNGAVQTCQVEEPSFRSMDMFINFSDPLLASKFDVEACTWAFGMNIFDLQEWRRRKLTRNYEEYLLLVMLKLIYVVCYVLINEIVTFEITHCIYEYNSLHFKFIYITYIKLSKHHSLRRSNLFPTRLTIFVSIFESVVLLFRVRRGHCGKLVACL